MKSRYRVEDKAIRSLSVYRTIFPKVGMRFKMEPFPLHLVTPVGIGELGDEGAWVFSKRVEREPITPDEKCLQMAIG